jgi:hypothetical protein
MTVEVCLDACHVDSYNYDGSDYGQEGYCGNVLLTEQAAGGQCNTACNGADHPFNYPFRP